MEGRYPQNDGAEMSSIIVNPDQRIPLQNESEQHLYKQQQPQQQQQQQQQPHHHHKRHHHKRHHHRMRMHDGNIRKLIDCDFETEEQCSCDLLENQDRIGQWGTSHPPKPQTKIKKNTAVPKRTRSYGSAGSQPNPLLRDRDVLRDEDNFRFRHYDDPRLFIKQYRQENTICIQGADPSGPPVLGRDTPDPYLAKLQQCGDLLERLMAFTAMARQQAEEQDPSRLQDRPLTKAMHLERATREYSASSSPEMSIIQGRAGLPRKAINLAPIRDCRLSVTNIKFPQKAPPKRQPSHIPQQQQPQINQQQLQQQAHFHPALTGDLQSPRIAFPLPVRIVVNSESLKGNKLTTLSPPHTPTKSRRKLIRSESTERPTPRDEHQRHPAAKLTKKRSESDIRCPPLSTASASDLSFSDSSIYEQYLAQRKKMGIKEDTTGHLLFSTAGGASTGGDVSGASGEKGQYKAPTVGLCELYSSGSGTLITAANNR